MKAGMSDRPTPAVQALAQKVETWIDSPEGGGIALQAHIDAQNPDAMWDHFLPPIQQHAIEVFQKKPNKPNSEFDREYHLDTLVDEATLKTRAALAAGRGAGPPAPQEEDEDDRRSPPPRESQGHDLSCLEL